MKEEKAIAKPNPDAIQLPSIGYVILWFCGGQHCLECGKFFEKNYCIFREIILEHMKENGLMFLSNVNN
jgi:hypothetical protein